MNIFRIYTYLFFLYNIYASYHLYLFRIIQWKHQSQCKQNQVWYNDKKSLDKNYRHFLFVFHIFHLKPNRNIFNIFFDILIGNKAFGFQRTHQPTLLTCFIKISIHCPIPQSNCTLSKGEWSPWVKEDRTGFSTKILVSYEQPCSKEKCKCWVISIGFWVENVRNEVKTCPGFAWFLENFYCLN